MPHGIFRERGEDGVHICMKYNRHNFIVPEEFYREGGYPPPCEELPWKEEFEAAKPRARDSHSAARSR